MALSWLAANSRATRKQAYGTEQRAVIDPDRDLHLDGRSRVLLINSEGNLGEGAA
jgi:hypothetical protein